MTGTVSEDIIEACGNIGIANILSIAKTVLNLIQIVGPILSIVALAICFAKLMLGRITKWSGNSIVS